MLKSQLKIYMFFVIFLYFYTPKMELALVMQIMTTGLASD